jgi:hypothetical protein
MLNYRERRREAHEQREPFEWFVCSMVLVCGAAFVCGVCVLAAQVIPKADWGLALPVGVAVVMAVAGTILNVIITCRGIAMYRRTKVLHPWLVVSLLLWCVPLMVLGARALSRMAHA